MKMGFSSKETTATSTTPYSTMQNNTMRLNHKINSQFAEQIININKLNKSCPCDPNWTLTFKYNK